MSTNFSIEHGVLTQCDNILNLKYVEMAVRHGDVVKMGSVGTPQQTCLRFGKEKYAKRFMGYYRLFQRCQNGDQESCLEIKKLDSNTMKASEIAAAVLGRESIQ